MKCLAIQINGKIMILVVTGLAAGFQMLALDSATLWMHFLVVASNVVLGQEPDQVKMHFLGLKLI